MTNDRYPNHPGFKEKGGTSEAAAKLMAPSAPRLRARCLSLIEAAPHGLTACQVAQMLEWELCSIRGRVTELYNMGLVRKDGRRASVHSRASAVVWVAVPADEVEAQAAKVQAEARRRAMDRAAWAEAA